MPAKKKHRFVEKGESHFWGVRPKTDEDAHDRCLGCLYFNSAEKSCSSPAFPAPIYVTLAHRHHCYTRGLAVFKQGYESGMTFDRVRIK
jgi:hypothetical protein